MPQSIGIDLDNTIIDYHNLFQAVLEQQLDKKFNKTIIKSHIKSIVKKDYGEDMWADIQAIVYGKQIKLAKLMRGFDSFLKYARKKKSKLYIVSHKTKLSQNLKKNYKLIEAANKWLENNNFFTEKGFHKSDIFFCNSLDSKVKKITELNLDFFIDDLEDVIFHKKFPKNTKGILFSNSVNNKNMYHTWSEVIDRIESCQ
ncbi:hypothetical protein OAM47_00805 [Gammaproteobacteria bacterium]|nr:hypothetical protein [Gammaproteobacteria bacterium]